MRSSVTTAAALEAITDRGKFELLATSVLRKAEPRYAPIIHTGVNAHEETVRAPLDGIQLLPHTNPPHFVFVQHTTTDRERLRRKWLTAPDADLTKAINEATTIRRDLPHALFTVLLCTNQHLDVELVRDVTVGATQARLAVDFWEQQRLAHFLDTTGDGHWLRKHFLGIEAERLSVSLLRHLCRQSLDTYRRQLLLPDHPHLVRRALVGDLLHAAEDTAVRLCLLDGASGFGKSLAALQALDERLDAGLLALWLPAGIVERAVSLEQALDEYLRCLHPSLERDAGRIALAFAGGSGRLMMVIDDLNRSGNPARLLRSLVGFAAPFGSPREGADGTSEGTPQTPAALVVPTWHDWLPHLPEGTLSAPWIRLLSVGALTREESVEILRAEEGSLSAAEAQEYANRLGHDPFGVGLFALLVRREAEFARRGALADDTVGRFIDAQLREVATAAPERFLLPELEEALVALGTGMLMQRRLHLRWPDVQAWFAATPQTLNGLRAIISHGHLCRLDEDSLVFRHDRLRDRILIDAMDGLLRLETPPEDVITDPFYAPFTGRALARCGHDPSWAGRMRLQAPLALFEAIRQFGTPREEHHREIALAAQAWAVNDAATAPPSLRWAVSWTLLETDSPLVLELVSALRPNALLSLAALRNGSARLALRYFEHDPQGDFEPGIGDRWRDHIVELAMARHAARLAADLRAAVPAGDLPQGRPDAFLLLLGHLRLSGFDERITSLWSLNRQLLLPHALWAAARCPLADVTSALGPMLDTLSALPSRAQDQSSICPREQIVQELTWAFRRGITRAAIEHFLGRAAQDAALQDEIAWMLDDVDDPDAAEFVVRERARHDGFDFRKHLTSLGDREPEVELLSHSTTARLRALWENRAELERVRVLAFTLWLRATGCRDLSLLRSIDRFSPFFRYALQHRVKLADLSSGDEVLTEVRAGSRGRIWWMMAYRVWGERLRAHAAETLAGLKDAIPRDYSATLTDQVYSLSDLLVMIPPHDAERLLEDAWEHLRYSPRMLQVALRVGTPTCVALAEAALHACPGEVDVFHLFSSLWRRPHRTNPLTIQHLENLLPILDRMKEDDVWHLATDAERAPDPDGAIARWIRCHLLPRLQPGARARVQVSDEAMLSDLDRFVQKTSLTPFAIHEIREPVNPFGYPRRHLQLLDGWLKTHATLRGLQVAAAQVAYIGTRADLALLTRSPMEAPPHEVATILADATFAVRRRSLT
jgi:hypothetical protein